MLFRKCDYDGVIQGVHGFSSMQQLIVLVKLKFLDLICNLINKVYREVRICTGKSKLLVDYHNVITARLIQSPPIHKLILENNFGFTCIHFLEADVSIV